MNCLKKIFPFYGEYHRLNHTNQVINYPTYLYISYKYGWGGVYFIGNQLKPVRPECLDGYISVRIPMLSGVQLLAMFKRGMDCKIILETDYIKVKQ